MSIVIKDGAAADRTLKTTLDTGVHTPHHIVDSIVAALPIGANAIGKLAPNSGVDIGDVDVTSCALPTGASTAANQTSTIYADDADWTDGSSKHVLVGGLYQSSPQTVTDGDVAPIQLDVNGRIGVALSPTDNAVLDTIDADTGAIKTAVELIDDAVYVDDADWTDSTSKHMLVGGLYQSSPQTVTDGDVAPIQLDVNGCVSLGTGYKFTGYIGTLPPATVYHGKTTVTTAGTEVTLASSQVITSGVTIKARSVNTGLIYVGVNPVTNLTGFELSAKESIFLEVLNLTTIYVDSAVDGEGVTYIAT